MKRKCVPRNFDFCCLFEQRRRMGFFGDLMFYASLQAGFCLLLAAIICRKVLIIAGQAFAYRLGLWKPKKAADKKEKEATQTKKKRVAVIGGGSTGITAAKCLIDDGHEVVVFEKGGTVGGNWVFTEKEGHSSIYESIVINTSKENMCYSDFPFPKELPYYLPHPEIKEYFESYAKHFHVTQHVRFHTEVVWVEPTDESSQKTDSSKGARWKVVSMKVDEEGHTEGERVFEEYDAVLVCSGHHWSPRWPNPKFEGQDDFEGEILHSHSFKSSKRFEGKRVVVVGVGNSGCDIVTECSKVGKQTYLSTRSGVFVIPKYYLGRPVDHIFTTRFMDLIPMPIKFLFIYFLTWIVRGLSSRYGLKQDLPLKKSHPTVNQEILFRISSHHIKVKPNIKQIKKNSVVFDDDTEVLADVIIFATGYHIEFPFMDSKKLIGYSKEDDNNISLYKFVAPLDYDTLFFVGYIQPLGAIFPISELQSRWISALLSGKATLPDRSTMEADIKAKKEHMAKEWVKAPRHTIQVDFVEYCDELADLIGVKPKLYKHWKILRALLFGVVTPVQYRLDGPGKWKRAEQEIQEIYSSS